MTINTQKLRQIGALLDEDYQINDHSGVVTQAADIIEALEGQVAEYARIAERTREEADARIDAQTAEIAEARSQIERLDRQNAGLRAQHDQDSKTLREYAQARDALEAENRRLREALRWTAGALQMACEAGEIMREADGISINNETRTVAQILDAADAALQESSHD